MKRLVLTLVMVLSLLLVWAGPALADGPLPEPGTAAPGTYHDVATVGGKGAALAQPAASEVRLSKYATKWVDLVHKFTYGIVVFRSCCYGNVPCTWAEMYSQMADGSPKDIPWMRLAQYMCIPGFGCTPWEKDYETYDDDEEDYGYHFHGPGLDGAVGVKAVGRFTFGYQKGGQPAQYDAYLVLSGWVTP